MSLYAQRRTITNSESGVQRCELNSRSFWWGVIFEIVVWNLGSMPPVKTEKWLPGGERLRFLWIRLRSVWQSQLVEIETRPSVPFTSTLYPVKNHSLPSYPPTNFHIYSDGYPVSSSILRQLFFNNCCKWVHHSLFSSIFFPFSSYTVAQFQRNSQSNGYIFQINFNLFGDGVNQDSNKVRKCEKDTSQRKFLEFFVLTQWIQYHRSTSENC